MNRRLFALLVVLGACSRQGGKPFVYPLDGVLRFDDVQLKATHNSYHVETSDIPEWEYTMQPLDVQLATEGVRSFELDLHYLQNDDGKGYHFEVYHVVAADEGTTCRLFVDCLRTLKRWSDRFPGHLPLYIELEPKDGFVDALAEQTFTDLENEILSVFPRRRVITPDEIRGGAATLPEALANGWPTLGQLRGRVLFGFDNRDDVRQLYTHNLQDLNGRLCFVDSDPTDPFGALTIQNDPVADAAAIQTALAAHLLVRTRCDEDGDQARADDMSLFVAALATGAHFISTDFPAPVSGLQYYITIPDGTPARCNPVTAPPDCTPLDLENPLFTN
jgi:hypothetical protein